MRRIKVLSAAVILSAAIATPVFAQEIETSGPRSYRPMDGYEWNYRGAYNRPIYYRSEQAIRNFDDFGFTGRDRSRPGGWDPHLNGGTGN